LEATHATQAPVHALSQQTPSAQNELMHWEPLSHDAPFVLSGWHLPELSQKWV
jgi:hypothetical protein